MKALIQKLVETDGPSGYEINLRSLVRSQVEPLADQVWVDNLGNLFARKGQAAAGGLKIMLAAHMDEIGLMVTHIDQAGFARFMRGAGAKLPGRAGALLEWSARRDRRGEARGSGQSGGDRPAVH
jgi:putative aminopeptidase FrvX